MDSQGEWCIDINIHIEYPKYLRQRSQYQEFLENIDQYKYLQSYEFCSIVATDIHGIMNLVANTGTIIYDKIPL